MPAVGSVDFRPRRIDDARVQLLVLTTPRKRWCGYRRDGACDAVNRCSRDDEPDVQHGRAAHQHDRVGAGRLADFNQSPPDKCGATGTDTNIARSAGDTTSMTGSFPRTRTRRDLHPPAVVNDHCSAWPAVRHPGNPSRTLICLAVAARTSWQQPGVAPVRVSWTRMVHGRCGPIAPPAPDARVPPTAKPVPVVNAAKPCTSGAATWWRQLPQLR